MRSGERVLKAVVGIVILFVVSLMVSNWIGDYRAASADAQGSSTESTQTAEPTQTPEPAAEGEGTSDATPSTGKTVVVLVDGLNFRSGPSRDSELVRGLDANEKLELLGEESGWLKVRDSKGETGYVSASGSYTRTE